MYAMYVCQKLAVKIHCLYQRIKVQLKFSWRINKEIDKM